MTPDFHPLFKKRMKNGRKFSSLNDNFELGANIDYMKNISEIIVRFDWTQHQRFLNSFNHYKTEIEGIGVHFLRSNYPEKKGQKKYPILLIHGYPNSFWDFYKLIPVLANPSRFGFEFGSKGTIIFDVIVPSIPGFGFSDKPSKPGFGFVECARIFGKLMARLGHDRYFVHGSSIVGSQIASALSVMQRKSIIGLHLSDPYFDITSSWVFMAKFYQMRLWSMLTHNENEFITDLPETDYYERPDSLSFALNDSPIGLTAFMMDRWAKGTSKTYQTHVQGGLQTHFTVDEFLTNVYIYWLTETFPWASRFLYYSKNHPLRSQFSRSTIDVPTGIISFRETPHQIPSAILELKYRNIIGYTSNSQGGEMAAIENWKMLAEEIFSFVELVTV